MNQPEITSDHSRLRLAFLTGVACAFVLIAYALWLVPSTSKASVLATAVVLLSYAAIGWFGPWRFGDHAQAIRTVSTYGLAAAAVFVLEIVLEYVLLPNDNTRMGYVEFGLVFIVYALASLVMAYQGSGLPASILTAIGVSMVSSLVWLIALLTVFYAFFGTARQQLVFRAEGNYEDFARSGISDFNTWLMEDFLGAGFYHLLLGPIAAAILGLAGGGMGVVFRRICRK